MVKHYLTKIKELGSKAKDIIQEKDLHRHQEENVGRARRFLHFWVLVIKSFGRNRCPVRASALAYTTLLAMVPMLAVVISVSTSLIREEGQLPVDRYIQVLVENIAPFLKESVTERASEVGGETNGSNEAGPDGGPEVVDEEEEAIQQAEITNRISSTAVVQEIKRAVENFNSGALTTTAIIFLLFVVIGMLSSIESTFNDIWGVSQGRSWFARIVQYWAAITLGPVFLISAVSLTAGSLFGETTEWLEKLPGLGFLRLFSLLILVVAFMLFYKLMPNTSVRWSAAFIGGLVGGSLLHLNNLLSFFYVNRVVTYSKIYGSLGTLPLFLAGLYLSWLILLFGAQVAYAYQNRMAYLQERQLEGINQRGREFVALRLVTLISMAFRHDHKPPTTRRLAEAIGAPSRLVTQVMKPLIEQQLVLETGGRETGYFPARPLEQITAYDVLTAMRTAQGQELKTVEDESRALVREVYDNLDKAMRDAGSGTTMNRLVDELARHDIDPLKSEPAEQRDDQTATVAKAGS